MYNLLFYNTLAKTLSCKKNTLIKILICVSTPLRGNLTLLTSFRYNLLLHKHPTSTAFIRNHFYKIISSF